MIKTNKIQSYILFCKKIIDRIEHIKATPFLWITGLLSIIHLRNIYEFFAEDTHAIHGPLLLTEYSLFWISLILAIILILKALSKEKISTIAKLVIVFSPFILIPVTVDLIVSLGKGYSMPYIVSDINYVLHNYLTFYNYGPQTATIGIKIEVIGACYLALIYILLKTRSIIKTIIGVLSTYTLTYIYMALPSVAIIALNISLRDLYAFGPDGIYYFMITLHLIMITTFSLIFLYIYHREKETTKKKQQRQTISEKPSLLHQVKAMIKNIRPFRSIHYIALLILGICLGAQTISNINWDKTILLSISIFCGWQFVIIVNDIFDVGIDEVSNRKRPLIQGDVSKRFYYSISLVFFISSITCSYLVGYKSFVLMLSFILLYSFLYSAPPFRLRRLFIIPNIIIGLCSVIAVFIGFSIYMDPFLMFPRNIALLIFIVLTFSSTIKDIKDYEGDKKEQIKTIPTLFGLEKGKKIIGILIAISFILVSIFIRIPYLFYATIPSSFFAYFFIVKKNEKWLFMLEFIFVIILLVLGSISGFPQQLMGHLASTT